MMAGRVKLTAAQAVVRWLCAQYVEIDGVETPYFAGCWAIFGHGNVAGLGEALYQVRDALPTLRAHNEQGMAHAAIAFTKQMRRQRAMVCTTSIGPGATNMVTAAALAHVNRLPILFMPGDVFANRRPDPVLQQIEDFADATVSANDCFRPVSRFFDRIARPEQIMDALPKALTVMLDPALCGPATLAFCQDTQAEAYAYPQSFFARRVWRIRRQTPDMKELAALAEALRRAKRPLLIAGGGVLYSRAETGLATFAEEAGLPVAETQAGKGALAWDHPCALGSIGVTGSQAANAAAAAADLVVAVGTRLSDFTTGSRTLLKGKALFQLNVQAFDAYKHNATPVIGDAGATIEALRGQLRGWRAPNSGTWREDVAHWNGAVDAATRPTNVERPSDAQVIGAVQGWAREDTIIVCAAGGLPGELHKLWRTPRAGGYHVEYGFSCMGYEIAGGLGVKLAAPESEVVVMVGDGSYLMMNSELASSVTAGRKIIVVLLDNRGFGCINRLQGATGGAGFNNLLDDADHARPSRIDFAAHARSLGAAAEKVAALGDLPAALARARQAPQSAVVVIETDPAISTQAGGWWWDVAVPEVSSRTEVNAARQAYDAKLSDEGDKG